MSRARIRGWRELAVRTVAATVAVVLGFGLLLVTGAGELDATRASFSGDVSLTTDAAGSALFHAEGLAPGRTLSNCVAVTYAGPDTPIEVRLHAASEPGALDEHLTLRVEVGDGGGFGDCAGFAGSERFVGTLATFVDRHGADSEALLVAAPSPPDATVTFRFSLLLDDHPSAQGGTSSSAYTWTATPTGGTPPVPPADPPLADPPPADPPADGPARTGAGDPLLDAAVPTEPVEGERTTDDPSPADAVAPAAPDAGDERADRADRDDRDGRPTPTAPGGGGGLASGPVADGNAVAELGADTWERVVQVATFVAKRSSYLLLLLLIVLAFLAVQDRIDRKDPKLALAPRAPDLDLYFEPPPSRPEDQ